MAVSLSGKICGRHGVFTVELWMNLTKRALKKLARDQQTDQELQIIQSHQRCGFETAAFMEAHIQAWIFELGLNMFISKQSREFFGVFNPSHPPLSPCGM
jgi:hypothetical protein